MVFEPRDLKTGALKLGPGIVRFSVGESHTELVIHKDVIKRAAPFFQAIVKEEWKKDETSAISLPIDNPDIVTLYFLWLYENKIYTKGPQKEKESMVKEQNFLIKAFVFGEKIQDRRFQDTVIDSLIMSTHDKDKCGVTYRRGNKAIEMGFAGTPHGSLLRKLLVDMALDEEVDGQDLPDNLAFLKQMICQLHQRCRWSNCSKEVDIKKSSCQYHSHGIDEDCRSKVSS